MRNGARQSGVDGDFGMAYMKQDSKGKRLSKSSPRTRSDTVMSTSSSIDSPTSPLSSPDGRSRHGSYDGGIPTLFTYQSESKSPHNSIFARGGRVLKRQGSKFSLLTLSEDRSEEPVRFSLARPETFRNRSKSASRQSMPMMQFPNI